MKLYFKDRMRSVTAGVLAVLMITASFTGCQQSRVLIDTDISTAQSQQVSSAVSSQVVSSSSAAPSSSQEEETVSSAASSEAASAVSSASSAASKPVQKLQTALPSAKTQTAAVTVKKIADDRSTLDSPRYNVINTKALASGYTHIDQRGGYNALPDLTSRSLYSQIDKCVYKVTATPTLEGYYPTQRVTLSGIRLSEAQLRLALIAYLNDNPQVFWIANVYSYGYNGNDTYVQLYSYVPQSECNAMIQQLNSKVTSIMQAMPQGLSEFDRELYLFDYITKNNSYNDAAVTNQSLWRSFCAYGALIDGKVVCEGYSRAMQLLSSYAGLQCLLVTGQGKNQNHMWNIIKIDGNWYHLDITWCDQSTTIYNYFNVTDAVIKQTHTISPLASTLTESEIDGTLTGTAIQCNLVVPACTATDANYYKVKGIRISDLSGTDDKAAIDSIFSAVQQKQQSVSFYVNDGADYASIISGLVQGSPYKMASYLSYINQRTETVNKVNIAGVKFLSDEANRGLTVFLSYQS
jgi:hypothetical protein